MSETNPTKRYSSGRFQRGRHEQLHAKPPENHHASKPLNSSNFKKDIKSLWAKELQKRDF
jgi:hypothetical protein